jgi:hypothetical protein
MRDGDYDSFAGEVDKGCASSVASVNPTASQMDRGCPETAKPGLIRPIEDASRGRLPGVVPPGARPGPLSS